MIKIIKNKLLKICFVFKKTVTLLSALAPEAKLNKFREGGVYKRGKPLFKILKFCLAHTGPEYGFPYI